MTWSRVTEDDTVEMVRPVCEIMRSSVACSLYRTSMGSGGSAAEEALALLYECRRGLEPWLELFVLEPWEGDWGATACWGDFREALRPSLAVLVEGAVGRRVVLLVGRLKAPVEEEVGRFLLQVR
jgi:hypothetical protein